MQSVAGIRRVSPSIGWSLYAPRALDPRRSVDVAEPWLSAEEIAAHLGITKDTVYDWIADKALPAHRVGRLWKFQASEIDEWVRCGGAAPAPADKPEEGDA